MVKDTTLASDTSSRFRQNVLEAIFKLVITIDDEIRDEKLQCDINREAAEISVLLSGKVDKNEYLTGEEILRSEKSRIT